MKIVNLTPHTLNFITDAGEVAVPPAPTPARCATTRTTVGEIEVGGVTIPIHRTEFGAVEGLPDPSPDTIYVVSALVAQAVPDRADVYIVDDAVRDDAGRIIGARALAHV